MRDERIDTITRYLADNESVPMEQVSDLLRDYRRSLEAREFSPSTRCDHTVGKARCVLSANHIGPAHSYELEAESSPSERGLPPADSMVFFQFKEYADCEHHSDNYICGPCAKRHLTELLAQLRAPSQPESPDIRPGMLAAINYCLRWWHHEHEPGALNVALALQLRIKDGEKAFEEADAKARASASGQAAAAPGLKVKTWRDGEPCDHAGCLNHVSHPCEGCGRIAGRAALAGQAAEEDQTEIASCGCTVMKGWRCPLHDAP